MYDIRCISKAHFLYILYHTLTFVKVFTGPQTAVLCVRCWHGFHILGFLNKWNGTLLCLADDALNIISACVQNVLGKYSLYQIIALQLVFKVFISTSSDDSRPLHCRQLCTRFSLLVLWETLLFHVASYHAWPA